MLGAIRSGRLGFSKNTVYLFFALLFCAGSLLGAGAAGYINESGKFQIYEALLRYTLAAREGTLQVPPADIIARSLGPFAFVCLAGLTPACGVIFPAVYLLKGFTMSYTVFSYCVVLGRWHGFLAGLALGGPGNILLLLSMILISGDGFYKTVMGTRTRACPGIYRPDREYVLRGVVAFALAGFSALAEAALTPALAALVYKLIP